MMSLSKSIDMLVDQAPESYRTKQLQTYCICNLRDEIEFGLLWVILAVLTTQWFITQLP